MARRVRQGPLPAAARRALRRRRRRGPHAARDDDAATAAAADLAHLDGVLAVDLRCGRPELRAPWLDALLGLDHAKSAVLTYQANRCGHCCAQYAIHARPPRGDGERLRARWGVRRRRRGPRARRRPAVPRLPGARREAGTADRRDGLKAFTGLVARLRPAFVIENVGKLFEGEYHAQVRPLFTALRDAGYEHCVAGSMPTRWVLRAAAASSSAGASTPRPTARRPRSRWCARSARRGAATRARAGVRRRCPRRRPLARRRRAECGAPGASQRLRGAALNEQRIAVDENDHPTDRRTLGVLLANGRAPLSAPASPTHRSRPLAAPADVPPDELRGRDLRALTIEQMLPLSSFPRDFQLYGATHAQGTLLGNAVPPRMGHAVAAALSAAPTAAHVASATPSGARPRARRAAWMRSSASCCACSSPASGTERGVRPRCARRPLSRSTSTPKPTTRATRRKRKRKRKRKWSEPGVDAPGGRATHPLPVEAFGTCMTASAATISCRVPRRGRGRPCRIFA